MMVLGNWVNDGLRCWQAAARQGGSIVRLGRRLTHTRDGSYGSGREPESRGRSDGQACREDRQLP